MSSATACIKSAPSDSRSAILCEALLRRRSELCGSWRRLLSRDNLKSLGPMGQQVETVLSGRDLVSHLPAPGSFTWLNCASDFWGCLQAIALGETMEYEVADKGPPCPALAELRKLPGPGRLQFLCERYRCPWNIAAPSEFEIAEELLRKLMVADRTRLEQGSAVDVDSVLLALNLTGIRALLTHDLRSLDALNYFYELPAPALLPLGSNSRLFAFWLCIYAQLLAKADWLRCA